MNRTSIVAFQIFLASTILSAANAGAANHPVPRPTSARILSGIESSGLSCPRIVNSIDLGESARGRIVRLTCAGLELTNQWDIRMIMDPKGLLPPEYEPW